MQARISQVIIIVLLVLAFFAAVVESAQGKVDSRGISGKYTSYSVPAPVIQARETVYRYFTVIEDRMPYNINDEGFLVVVELWVDLDAYPNVYCDGLQNNDDGQNCVIIDKAEIALFLTKTAISDVYSVEGY